MRKLLIFTLGAALVLAISGPALALDLNIDAKFDFNVGGTNFSAITEGSLIQQAGADVFGVGEIITKNDGKVISKVDLPNLDVDQIGVPLGRVDITLGALGTLQQLTAVEAACTDFALSKNEGLVVAKVDIDGPVYINNINPFGLYPYDPWNGQEELAQNFQP